MVTRFHFRRSGDVELQNASGAIVKVGRIGKSAAANCQGWYVFISEAPESPNYPKTITRLTVREIKNELFDWLADQ